MCYELTDSEFDRLRPLLDDCLPDPMLYTVIEGNQPGRVIVDDREMPGCAFIWPMMEYSYVIGRRSSPAYYQSLRETIEAEILPALAEDDMGFLSVIPFNEWYREVFLELFQDRHPLSLGVNIFSFDQVRFTALRPASNELPVGFALREMDRGVLENTVNEHTLEDIIYCWGSLERFVELVLGTCMLEGERIVSCCYALAYGAQAYHVNIWTGRDHRRKGFARAVCATYINRCLEQGKTLYWLCDRDNLASRRLAQSLGYEYRGDLFPVDIPNNPYAFYLGLGEHFYTTLQLYDQAARLYEKALTLGEPDKEAYYLAARALALAGDAEMCLKRLYNAVETGWDDIGALLGEEVFKSLHVLPEWKALIKLLPVADDGQCLG